MAQPRTLVLAAGDMPVAAHVDTTRNALEIGSSYRQPVSIADMSTACHWGGLAVLQTTSVTTQRG